MTPNPSPDGGVLDGGVHRYGLRVFFEDTDAGGVVYHANYLRWFERARSDLLLVLGIDQRAALEAGEGVYTVAEANLQYLAPARLGDVVIIDTWAHDIRRASCVMRQTAWTGDTRLCEATIRLGFVGRNGRPRAQPQAWRDVFAAIQSVPEGPQ